MATDNTLDSIDTVNLDQTKPVIPWLARDFDGFESRNVHERALGDRDNYLLDLIKAVKSHGVSNVSPLYPFAEADTLVPSMAVATDADGVVIPGFTVDPSKLVLSNRFLRDLKVILTTEFQVPYLHRLVLRKYVDPVTLLVRIFVDLYFSARYTGDQLDYEILSLTEKAYNDVQDNSSQSSRDLIPFDLTALMVANREWINSGVITFGFIGAVQSGLSTSWSAGVYNGVTVEGFSTIPELKQIEFTFSRPAAALAELSYSRIGDLQKAVPFLSKIVNYPFDSSSSVGSILTKYVPDISVTGPWNEKVYIKRIRRHLVSTVYEYVFMFAYDSHDNAGNYTATVNVGIATVTQTSGSRVRIQSLGSTVTAGADPDWLDEVIGNTSDNLGAGYLTVTSWEDLGKLYDELLATPVEVGSPSPILVSPIAPDPIYGLFVDPDIITMIEANSTLDSLVVDTQGKVISVTKKPSSPYQLSNNDKITIDGVLVNRRTCYGAESVMRDFYGIPSTESLINNDKIPLEDQWYDTGTNVMKQYQFVQGSRRWRSL
jgi:hypothetical protein